MKYKVGSEKMLLKMFGTNIKRNHTNNLTKGAFGKVNMFARKQLDLKVIPKSKRKNVK